MTFYWFGKKHGLGIYTEDIDPPSAVWYKHGVKDGLVVGPVDQYGGMSISTYVDGKEINEVVYRAGSYQAGPKKFAEVYDSYSTGEWLRDRIIDVAYGMLVE